MNSRTRALSNLRFGVISMTVLSILCLGLISGCGKSTSTSTNTDGIKQSSKEKLLYSKNGLVYETDLSGSGKKKVFSSRHNALGYFRYFPEKQAFVYVMLDEDEYPQHVVLREYLLETKEDKKIDSIEAMMASDDKGMILYTKRKNADETETVFKPANELFLYAPGGGTRKLGIDNISRVEMNADTNEICYSSFSPFKEMVDPSNDIYMSKLDTIKPQLIASFPKATSAVPVSFCEKYIVYVWGETNEGAQDHALYLFDRKTKKVRLIEESAKFLALDKKKNTLLIAKEASDNQSDLSIWKIQLENDDRTELFHLTSSEKIKMLTAKYSPDGSYVAVLYGWGGVLGVYNFSSKRYKEFPNRRDAIIQDFIFTPDGKSILCTVGKPLSNSSIHKDVIYKIELKSGEYTAITEPEQPSGNEFIKLIGVY